jgi:hypothetical protein
MDFFNKLGDSIQNVSKEATKKAKDLSGTVSLNAQIKESESGLEKLYKAIGEKYYNTYTADAEEKYTEECAQIKVLKEKIEKDRKSLRELKGLVLCPNCGAEVEQTAAHCPKCGTFLKAEVVEPVVTPEQQTSFCPGCGEAVVPGTKFCGKCGTKLD